jgi:hypothetical protein
MQSVVRRASRIMAAQHWHVRVCVYACRGGVCVLACACRIAAPWKAEAATLRHSLSLLPLIVCLQRVTHSAAKSELLRACKGPGRGGGGYSGLGWQPLSGALPHLDWTWAYLSLLLLAANLAVGLTHAGNT